MVTAEMLRSTNVPVKNFTLTKCSGAPILIQAIPTTFFHFIPLTWIKPEVLGRVVQSPVKLTQG